MADDIKILGHSVARGRIWQSIHNRHGQDLGTVTAFQSDGKKWLRMSFPTWGVETEVIVDEFVEKVLERLKDADSNDGRGGSESGSRGSDMD